MQRLLLALIFSLIAIANLAVASDGVEVEQAESAAETIVSAQDLLSHLEYLASPDRRGRDDWGKIESADYIIARFEESGLQPLFEDGFIQAVPDFNDKSADPIIMGRNIGGFVEGTDPLLKREWIVVNAHYDHLGVRGGKIFPGADDNASGVSMLLELAKHFAKNPARRSIAFVSFDLEEHLLWGSRWFLAHCPLEEESIRFCLTADMIGRSLGGLDIPTVFVMGAETSPQVSHCLDQIAVPEGLEVARLGTDIVGTRSDYGPFRYRKIPFLFFSTGEHPDYHTPEDTLEKLDIDKIALVSTAMLRVADQIANLPSSIEWDVDETPSLHEVRAINSVTKQLLEAEEMGEFEMTDLQRLFVSQVKSKTSYMLRTGKISPTERTWLVRSTQLMMFSLF
ncbi:M28 family peptidase [Thalassoglobus sp. JC818]|uniref:M28 family peptidase n=1 Tax=Thalassoglobus sp. JC818 TaxID=3232136 RepID=UPI0034596BAB